MSCARVSPVFDGWWVELGFVGFWQADGIPRPPTLCCREGFVLWWLGGDMSFVLVVACSGWCIPGGVVRWCVYG